MTNRNKHSLEAMKKEFNKILDNVVEQMKHQNQVVEITKVEKENR